MENDEPFAVERVYYFNTLPCFSACPVGFYCTRSAPIFQNLSYGKTLCHKTTGKPPLPFFWNSFSDCSGPYFFVKNKRARKKRRLFPRAFSSGSRRLFSERSEKNRRIAACLAGSENAARIVSAVSVDLPFAENEALYSGLLEQLPAQIGSRNLVIRSRAAFRCADAGDRRIAF